MTEILYCMGLNRLRFELIFSNAVFPMLKLKKKTALKTFKEKC